MDDIGHRRATVLAAVPLLLLAVGAVRTRRPRGQPLPNCRGPVIATATQLDCTRTEADKRVGAGRPASARASLWMGRRMDLNRVAATDLMLVPGIGPRLACRLVEDRHRNGPFAAVAAARRVRGVGPKLVARLRDYAAVYPSRPGLKPPSFAPLSPCP